MPAAPREKLSLPAKLLKEIGAESQSANTRRDGRSGPRGSRKERRKVERSHKKQRSSTARRDFRQKAPESEDEEDGEDGEDEEDDVDQPPIATPITSEPKPKSILKKRKRSEIQASEETLPTERLVPRSIRDKLAKDDAEIEDLERKLGLKKGRKTLPKSFKDDGLDDILGGSDGDSDSQDEEKRLRSETNEWLAQKRRKATGAVIENDSELEEDDEEDDETDSQIQLSEDDDSQDSEDEFDFEEDDDINVDEHAGEEFDDLDSQDDSFEGFESEGESAPSSKRVRENPYLPPSTSTSDGPKYVPPSLRQKSRSDSDLEAQIRRRAQGPVNRVTESNMASIVQEVEKLYLEFPRSFVTSTLTDLLMAQVCDPTAKPDTLLVLSAGFISAIYKVIGIEFAANFVDTIAQRFRKEHEIATQAVKEERIPTKETSNMITVLSEMYIFRIIGSNLIFDYIRLLLSDLSELNAELLLRIVRMAGPQLRKDDPLALKDIVSLIRPAVSKIGEENLSVRTKFMIETISDLKNNKLKAGAQDLAIVSEHVTRMKKVLGSLDTRKVKATEPLRIGLKDIENADKAGKWWIVGASWGGQGPDAATSATTKDKTTGKTTSNDDGLGGDDMDIPDYLELAREQGMNTDVRRAIFIALVAAADYQDAYLRILKLRLNKYNRREIANVLVQCAGAQQYHNPYYTLVANKFCEDGRIKYAFQDSLWTLFRRLGESLFGDQVEDEDDEVMDDRRVINTAKMFGTLVADSSLGLGILKPLNLAYLKGMTSLFVEVMLITVLQECRKVKAKEHSHGLEASIEGVFGRGVEPELGRALRYFLRKKVKKTDLVESKKEAVKLKEAWKIADAVLKKAELASGQDADDPDMA